MIADTKSTSGRAFVRSLNILLKFARLYGFEHSRTIEQLDIAWRELRSAIPTGTDAGLMLGATGSQLLLDGVPLEGAPAEKQFAQLLSAAGLASVQFFASVTGDELARFVRAFPTGKAKPAELAMQLKAALTGAQGIRINEICFVATDSRLKEASMAAQLAVASLGDDQDQFKKWLNDPQKLLELIAAAQGSRGGGTAGSGTGPGGSGSGGGYYSGAGDGSGGIGGNADGVGGSSVGGSGVGNSGIGGSGLEGPGGGGSGVGGSGVGGTGIGGGLPGGAYASGVGGAGVAGQIQGVTGTLLGAGPGGSGSGGGNGAGGGPWHGTGKSAGPSEDEIYGILGALTSFGNVGAGQGGVAAAGEFQQQMNQLPGTAQDTLKRAIAGLAAKAPEGQPDESVLVKLAEHLAIRFALERFERGEG